LDKLARLRGGPSSANYNPYDPDRKTQEEMTQALDKKEYGKAIELADKALKTADDRATRLSHRPPFEMLNVLAGSPRVWENAAAARYLAMHIGDPGLLCNWPVDCTGASLKKPNNPIQFTPHPVWGNSP
jgi:hypothetical protein